MENHVHSRGSGEGQGRKRAGWSKTGEGHPLPRQLEHTLENRRVQSLVFAFFVFLSLGSLDCYLYWFTDTELPFRVDAFTMRAQHIVHLVFSDFILSLIHI